MLRLTCKRLILDDGGRIDLSGKGYKGGQHKGFQGFSYKGESKQSKENNFGGGGGAGLMGGGGAGFATKGVSGYNGGKGGRPYGNKKLTPKVLMGSGGGTGLFNMKGTSGGGAIIIECDDCIIIGSGSNRGNRNTNNNNKFLGVNNNNNFNDAASFAAIAAAAVREVTFNGASVSPTTGNGDNKEDEQGSSDGSVIIGDSDDDDDSSDEFTSDSDSEVATNPKFKNNVSINNSNFVKQYDRLTSVIFCNGEHDLKHEDYVGCGSGGSIWLKAPKIINNGVIKAIGGRCLNRTNKKEYYGNGGMGRVRIDINTDNELLVRKGTIRPKIGFLHFYEG